MKIDELLGHVSTTPKLLNFLTELKLLKASRVCDCGSTMKLCTDTQLTDGFILRCGVKECRKEMSIRTGSCFEKSELSLKKILILMHLWAKKYPENLILEDYDYSSQTVVDWFHFFRDVCVSYIEQKKSEQIGGVGKVVEIDETIIVKRKDHKGGLITEQWLFGGIERSSDGGFNYFVEFVNNRDADTLEEVIQRKIMPGTSIISNGWTGYSGLAGLGYHHEVIVHKDNYSDARVRTQNIKNSWLQLKRFLREKDPHGSPRQWEYICEYLLRKEYKDVFTALVNKINNLYPM